MKSIEEVCVDKNLPTLVVWSFRILGNRSATQGQWNSAENMTHPLYKYGFVINYNTERIPNKGSAIFFHIGTSYTLGCTATSESNVISILKWLDPSKNPVIIQTPIQELGSF
jgi:hypothetical protein